MDEQELLHQPAVETLERGEAGDPLTESLAGSMHEIEQNDRVAEAQITEAQQSGNISGDEASALREQKKGCLLQVMGALSRAVPDRFKPRLQAALARNVTLEKSYIASIDPQLQHEELTRLREYYENKVIEVLYDEKSSAEALARAVGRFAQCIDQAGYDYASSKELVDMIYRLSFMGSSDAISPAQKAESAYALTEQAMGSGNEELAASAARKYLENFDHNPAELLKQFSPDEAERVAYEVIQDRSYSLYKRGGYVFEVLGALPADKRDRILQIAARQLKTYTDDGVTDGNRIDIAKKLLNYTEGDQQQRTFDALTSQGYHSIIKTEDPIEQVRHIQELTGDQTRQDQIFSSIRRNDGDYRHVRGFDINQYIARLPHGGDNTYFVHAQHEAGYISDEAYRAYGRLDIRNLISQGATSRHDLERIIALHERYGLDLGEHTSQLTRVAEQLFGQGTIDRRLHSLLKKIGTIEMSSEWEDFNHDMQTTEKIGERTWREEQSLIDILQNHLDANDMKCGIDLASSIFGRQAVIDMLEHGNFGISHPMGDMLEHKKRQSNGDPDSFMPRMVDRASTEEYDQAVEDVPYTVPTVEICMESLTGVRHWMPYEELGRYNASEGRMIGVRFTDNGLGYDEQLNALFAPTKTEFPFLRGQFGQGAKMSMARLLASGCQITTRSSCQVLESGERIEWEGRPTYSQETRTLHFTGRKRRVYNTAQDAESGTSTEIMFADADHHTARVLSHMLETRQENPGLGRYVFEYLPTEVRASYKDAKPYDQRYSPADWVRVSRDPQQSGVVYVQGLEAPSRSLHLAFSYDFKNKELFTGADRAWLENDKVKTEIVEAWSYITDADLVNSFHDMLLGDRGFHNETYWVNSLQYMLRPETKKVHQQLLKDRLGLQEGSRGVVFTSRAELQHYADHIQRLTNAGYIIYPVTSISQESVHFFQYVCGDRYRITLMEDAAKEIDSMTHEGSRTNEAVSDELAELLKDTRADVDRYLRDAGLVSVADALAAQKIEISLSDSDDHNEVYILGLYNAQEMRRDGVCISITARAFTNSQTPETLEGENREYVRFLTEMSLLSIAGGATDTSKRSRLLGQEVVNQLLDASVSEELRTAAEHIRIDYEEPPEDAGALQETIRADERFTSFQSSLRILQDKKSDFESIQAAVDVVNRLCASGPLAEDVRQAMHSLSGTFCFDGTMAHTMMVRLSEGDDTVVNGIDLYEVESEQIGEVNGIPLYVADRSYYQGTVLLLPLDFNARSTVMLHDEHNRRTVSAYDTGNPPRDWRDDPTGKFSTEEFFNDLILNHAHVGNGVLVFPIGAYDRQLVEDRIAYAKNGYHLSVESGGAVRNEEMNRDKDYIETTLSTEYGEGKGWDNPVRIFGDIVQNHMDEGGTMVDIRFEIITDRGREWISADELKQSHNADVRISGVRFADNGRGYTTRQLTVLSESTKNGDGQRGKFGTGLKMLTASCVRHGLDLQFGSRDWKATASSRRRNIIQHGVPRDKDIVGFNMDWRDEENKGSYTEVRLPDGDERRAGHIWHKWTETIDPRITDAKGNAGLERYVRSLRKRQDGIRIGKVTILPDEPGAFFEGGILVPGAEGRTGKQYLFGYDIDEDIVATQERNVIDPAKLRPLLSDAFKQLPPELCKILIQQTFALDTENEDDVPAEYSMLNELTHVSALRLAYFNRFGEKALLSTAAMAKEKLKYGYADSGQSLSEMEQAILMSVITAEETRFDSSQVIRFRGKAGSSIASMLMGDVPSTYGLMTSRAGNSTELMDLPGDASERLQQFVRIAAREMADNLNRIYESGGRDVLHKLLNAPDRQYIHVEGDTAAPARSMEHIIAYYEEVAAGQRTLDLRVGPLDGTHAFIHGNNGITFGARSLQEADLSGGTARHELNHLGTNLADYNSAFMGLLMLNVPAIAKRYASPVIA